VPAIEASRRVDFTNLREARQECGQANVNVCSGSLADISDAFWDARYLAESGRRFSLSIVKSGDYVPAIIEGDSRSTKALLFSRSEVAETNLSSAEICPC